MSNLLFDYILNVLAPKEYRLELKNRLENLCSLSGQTMSPGLTKWLTKTFGIEMVRVIQDYATLGGNKFPPDYFEKIKRLVPGNYKGYDANQGFKQLFDVGCASPKCLYYAETFNYTSGWSGFNLDIDGTYFPSTGSPFEIGTSIQSAYNTEAGGYARSAQGNSIKLWSLENDPIDTTWQILNFDDFNWYPVDMLPLSCDLTTNCYSVSIPHTSVPVNDFILEGNFVGSPVDSWTTGLTSLSASDPQFLTLLQSIFGGQAIIAVNDNGGSTFIQIDNCYEAIHPKTIETGILGSYNFQTCNP